MSRDTNNHLPGECHENHKTPCDMCREFRAFKGATLAEKKRVLNKMVANLEADPEDEGWAICKCGGEVEMPVDCHTICPVKGCRRIGCFTYKGEIVT